MQEVSENIEKHKQFLMHFAMQRCNNNKENAENLFQDMTLRLLISCDKYDYNKGKFTTYAARVMTNKAIDDFRKRKTKPIISVSIDICKTSDDSGAYIDNMFTYENSGQFINDVDFIKEAVNDLSKKEIDILNLRMLGFKFCEISKITGIKSTTLRALVRRARIKLAENLEELI